MKIEEFEKVLRTKGQLKLGKIYVKDKKFKDFKDIVRAMLDDKQSTYYAKNNALQCGWERLRGIADMYRTCLYYFPDTSLKDLYTFLKEQDYVHSFCYTTNQTVYRGMKVPGYNHYNNNVVTIRDGRSNRSSSTLEL